MIGRIKFWNQENHFGFILYSSLGSNRLDCEIHFHDSALHSSVEPGDFVEFLIGDHNGKPTAIDIALTDDRLTGVVINTGKQQYCFIEVTGRYGDDQRVFCAFDDVEPDPIGRRALTVGTPVSFRVEPKGDGIRERAVDVRNEDPALANIDVKKYREFGKVEWYDADRGHIRRPCGDTVAFLKRNVITEGVETIRQGTWLQYGINRHLYLFDKERQRFRQRVYARDIAVCMEDANSQPIPPIEQGVEPDSAEAYFMTAPELPLNEPESDRLKPSDVYLPSEKKMSLKQLIARRSAA
jgi:cold shock CspA family protein